MIHGVWNHEETRATASQAVKFGGHFFTIRNMEEARVIERYLKKEFSKQEFMKRFGGLREHPLVKSQYAQFPRQEAWPGKFYRGPDRG